MGSLRAGEVEPLYTKGRYAVLEMAVAMAIFRSDFGAQFLVLFGFLMLGKVFHWLCADRVSFLEQSVAQPWFTHIRQLSLMILLLGVDLIGVFYSLQQVRKLGPSMHLLFLQEYILLSVAIGVTLVKYTLTCHNLRMDGRWENKGQWMYGLENCPRFFKAFCSFCSFSRCWLGLIFQFI